MKTNKINTPLPGYGEEKADPDDYDYSIVTLLVMLSGGFIAFVAAVFIVTSLINFICNLFTT